MAITTTGGKLHWNYLLALDRDMEAVSRYIEFATPNLGVYSIELAHLLFAAASEVDVLAKLVCKQNAPSERPRNIDDYKPIILRAFPDLPTTAAYVPRYGMSFAPWDNWSGTTNPDWWRAYNNVKHERDRHFQEATLKNALNAIGGLMILTFHYYTRAFGNMPSPNLDRRTVTRQLVPSTGLIRFDESWYDVIVVT